MHADRGPLIQPAGVENNPALKRVFKNYCKYALGQGRVYAQVRGCSLQRQPSSRGGVGAVGGPVNQKYSWQRVLECVSVLRLTQHRTTIAGRVNLLVIEVPILCHNPFNAAA
jgi:hypothetical protein